MSHRISEAALKQLPKKPLNAYFKHRSERLHALADHEDRVKLVKREWDEMPEKEKKALDEQYHSDLEQYKKDMEDWKHKYNIDEEDMKLVRKYEKENKEGKKSEKSKGSKVEPKDEKKEKSKSKDTKPDKKAEVSKEKKDDKKKDDKKEDKGKAKPKK